MTPRTLEIHLAAYARDYVRAVKTGDHAKAYRALVSCQVTEDALARAEDERREERAT